MPAGAAPDIPRVEEYTGQGLVEYVYFEADTFADYLNPTRAELATGTTITPVLCGKEGWTSEVGQIPTPNARDKDEGSIPGKRTYERSSVDTYVAQEGEDARDLMVEGDAGFMGRYPSGDVAGRRLDLFPVRCASSTLMDDISGESADTNRFTFTITRRPLRNFTVPAHTP